MRLRKMVFPAFMLLSGNALQAGEIIVAPEPADHRASGAYSQRERAGAYQRGPETTAADDEGGFLAPRGGAPAEARAFDNRMRARAYQQGGDGAGSPPASAAYPGDAPERARDLHSRARVYTGSGNAKDVDLSHVGPDGIPVVPCRGEVDNVAARIGEDNASGSLFYIMRNGKPVKVRCR